jgi:predicted nuclease with TOPRIM domain
MDPVLQIIITVIGVLSSASIWKYFEERLKINAHNKKLEYQNDDGVQYRDDLKDRVRNLETLLAKSADEKDELRNYVLQLTAEVNTLRVKVEFLEDENHRLKNK